MTGGALWDEAAVSVLVADDHPMRREAVARDLTDAGFNVIGTADDGRSAVGRTLATRSDVLVLDLTCPACAERRCATPSSRHADPDKGADPDGERGAAGHPRSGKAGATGYLLKSAGREEFLDAVRATARGRAVFTPGLAGLVLGEFRRLAAEPAARGSREVPELTPRETEVLKLVATGMSCKQIGSHLSISHRTAQNHVQNTLNKLQLLNRVELVRFAIARGLDVTA